MGLYSYDLYSYGSFGEGGGTNNQIIESTEEPDALACRSRLYSHGLRKLWPVLLWQEPDAPANAFMHIRHGILVMAY